MASTGGILILINFSAPISNNFGTYQSSKLNGKYSYSNSRFSIGLPILFFFSESGLSAARLRLAPWLPLRLLESSSARLRSMGAEMGADVVESWVCLAVVGSVFHFVLGTGGREGLFEIKDFLLERTGDSSEGETNGRELCVVQSGRSSGCFS